MSDVYLRTERGAAALNDPQAKLDPWLKHALRLMNGKRDAAAILRSCPPGAGEKILETLAELGLTQKLVPASAVPQASELTQPMPIVTEMPPAPAGQEGLRQVSRPAPSPTGAFRSLGPERLQEVKLILANGLMDNAGPAGDALAKQLVDAATFMDLAKLIPEAEALTSRIGDAQLAAYQALVKEQGLPTAG